MNPQLEKEFRAILLPWCLALVIAVVIPQANFLVVRQIIDGGPFVNFVQGLTGFAFLASLLAIAAIPYGIEFQFRTLPLLLSQPMRRDQIWRYKVIVSCVGIASALLVLAVTTFGMQTVVSPAFRTGVAKPADTMSVLEIELTALSLLLPTIGSATFWTLIARSTLGGMVFTALSELLYFGILAFIAERVFGLQNAGGTPMFVIAGFVYGVSFFGLSRRQFSRFEMRQVLSDVLGSKSLAGQGLRVAWLRCQPSSGWLNLIRKEIQLQRPLLIIAAILCALWAVASVFPLVQPGSSAFSEVIFALTIGFYLPLMSMLAGCISLGEEKNLGINAWQLSLPISARRQWTIKLLVSLSAWLILGVLLPFGLASLGAAVSKLQFYKEMELQSWLGLSLFMTCVFAFSFWAMTLFSDTVRAVIGGIAIVVALCSAAALAYWIMIACILPYTFLQTILVYDTDWQGASVLIVVGATTVLLGLLQSFIQFRQLQTSPRVIFNHSFGLVLFIFLATICYFPVLAISKNPLLIYLMLFVLMLIFLRQKSATIQRIASS
jgi:hypothetical protein